MSFNLFQDNNHSSLLPAGEAEIIPEVPLDPFTDKPFIYRIDQDQKLYLYSIGKNLTDDGGDEKLRNDIVISPIKQE